MESKFRSLKNKNKPRINTTIDSDYGRRKWDVENKSELIKEKEKNEDEEDLEMMLPVERTDYMKARAHELGVNKRAGKVIVLGQENKDKKIAIFKCKVCDVDFNDSISYADHLNGKKHNRILGMNMKVERVTAKKIRDKLERLGNGNKIKEIDIDYDKLKNQNQNESQENVELGKREIENENQENQEVEKDEEEEEEDEFVDALDEEDIKEMEAMGIPFDFGTTKKFK